MTPPTVMIEQSPGAPKVECWALEIMHINYTYRGVTSARGVIFATWNGEVFVCDDDPNIRYRHPSDDTKELHWFLPVADMNDQRLTFAIKYTVLINDRPSVVHYLRQGMGYGRAWEIAGQIADALGLKEGLPTGFLWLTCTPADVEETITIERA